MPVDWLQFISSIVQSIVSLAWPAAFVAAVWLFREKLIELLPRLTVKHKEWEASFRWEKAEDEVAALPPVPPSAPEEMPTPEEKSRFEQIAELSPRAAILEVRSDLAQTVAELAEEYSGSSMKKPISFVAGIRALRNNKIIDPQTSALLDDLRAIGNEVAHNPETKITKELAMRFKMLSDAVQTQLAHALLIGPTSD